MTDAKNQATVAELIAELNGDDTNQAEEAQATLEQYGAAVLAPLLDAAPRFGRFGQLCAIELFQRISDPRAGTVLIPMLRSDHDTVREWAAQALGDLGVREAVPGLQAAYERAKQSRIPPDWSEPQSIRDALTQLGARDEVIPALVRERIRTEPIIGRCWLPSDLPDVIESLAAASQVVLSFTYWERWRDTRTWVETPSWDLDWSLPWDRLIASARNDALDAAARAGTPADTVAVVSWLDEADR
jgi:HEAT repeat protein